MRLSAIFLLALAVLLVACADSGGDDGGSTEADDGQAVIQWPQEPSHVVFRADVVGGADFDSFLRLGEVPECTVYGDGRIVWVSETAQGDDETLFNIVTPANIRDFVSTLTLVYDIYGQTAAADLNLDSTSPVVEQLQINVNGEEHVTDIFGGWDYDYFEELLRLCVEAAGPPTIFEPDGAWLNVQAATFDSRSPLQRWDAEITGVDLAEIAAEDDPVWVEGRLLEILWDLTERNPPDLQLDQNGDVFLVALQVPNITRNAPPAPGN